MIVAPKKQREDLKLYSDEIMNFKQVMPVKMMNCDVEQPGLDGDLGRPSHRTRKERNLSDSEKSEEKDRLISSLISRLMVTKDDNN